MSFFGSSNPRKHVVVDEVVSIGKQVGAILVAHESVQRVRLEVRNAGFPSPGLVLPSTPMTEVACQPTE
jgi:hypothetical protein